MTNGALDRTKRWLRENDLNTSTDPDVTVLLEAAAEMDWLNDSGRDLSEKERVAARRTARHAVTTARRNIQRLLDASTSARQMRRHQLMYGGVAARSLGWVDMALLPTSLRDDIADHLRTEHDIDIEDYREEAVQL
ncbi:hypothetical protein [Candidatus Poriferisocius sp.]|uniref:hypothetical protein n=1 Tax=Candidatus Poriferisocius sp. TaxID=3101276 RepID=UPI003B521FBD